MYECLGMHDDWQFVRQNFAETDGTLEYWARNGSRSDIYLQKFLFWGCSRLKIHRDHRLKVGSCKIVEKDKLNGIAACWNSHVNASDIASVVNAFCMFVFFIFIFIIPFLPGSPFRVFDPPGNSFFTCHCFCLNCL